MNKDILAQYQNGNTSVTILKDGTKIRKYCGDPLPQFPESIDIKITNYCDLGCSMCHEDSNTEGSNASLYDLKYILDPLPRGIELAIGGGNPLAYNKLDEFLEFCHERGFIPNMTVNGRHIRPFADTINRYLDNGLIYGLGVSDNEKGSLEDLNQITKQDNIVIHLIAGYNQLNRISYLNQMGFKKILILGYKTWGRGEKIYRVFQDKIQSNLDQWKEGLMEYYRGNCLIFDNLAIEQLQVSRLFTKTEWNQMYMGDEFTHSMYIDGVKREMAATSRSKFRVSFDEMDLIHFFKIRNASMV